MRVKLSRDAWHYKLQTFVWGSATEGDFCSYFWSTVFSLLMFPIAIFGKLVKPIIFREGMRSEEDLDHIIRYERNNLEAGITGIATAIIIVVLFTTPLLSILMFIDLFAGTFGVPLATLYVVGTVTVIGVSAFAIYKTSELWIPFLWSIKDSVCPLVEWQE